MLLASLGVNGPFHAFGALAAELLEERLKVKLSYGGKASSDGMAPHSTFTVAVAGPRNEPYLAAWRIREYRTMPVHNSPFFPSEFMVDSQCSAMSIIDMGEH